MVARRLSGVLHLKGEESVDGISPEAASALTSVCGIMHSSVAELSERYYARTGRKNYVTPTSYLELLSTFASLVGKRREETMRLKIPNLTANPLWEGVWE